MGAQRLQSVSADIRTQAGTEDVECKTVSGDVDIAGQGHRALLTLTTVSGDARVRGVAGEVNANTVSGNARPESRRYDALACARRAAT